MLNTRKFTESLDLQFLFIFANPLFHDLAPVFSRVSDICEYGVWPFKYHITGNMLCYDNSRTEFSQINFFAISI